MVFPTVGDCLKSRGPKRDVFHGFDQLLREALGRTRLKAHNLDLDDSEVGMACVTVMMTVAADLALAASENPADIEASHFSKAAEDALAWAKGRLAGRAYPRKSRAEGVVSPSSVRGAPRGGKNRLM
jgi:hypothetical protein